MAKQKCLEAYHGAFQHITKPPLINVLIAKFHNKNTDFRTTEKKKSIFINLLFKFDLNQPVMNALIIIKFLSNNTDVKL